MPSENDNGLVELMAKSADGDEYQRRFKRMIAEVVDQQVQEALSHQQDAVFQPFFQSKTIANEIRCRQTVAEQQKWTHYFAEWGCLVCETKRKGTTR